MPQCTAKSGRSGERCKNHAVTGRKTCRIHGGTVPVGIASPHFKHGRHSKYMQGNLLSSYETFLADSDRLNLDSEIALIDARIAEQLEKVGKVQDSRTLWKALQEAHKKLETANRQRDGEGMEKALAEISYLIKTGFRVYNQWEEITDLIERRRKLVDSERKRLLDAQQYITVEQALGFAHAVMASVKQHVTDYDTLKSIAADLSVIGVGKIVDGTVKRSNASD